VALAAFTTVLDDKLPERVTRMGRYLTDGLRRLAGSRTDIREIRGRGLLIGMELTRPAGPVMDACREAGLLILTAGEKVARLAPPLIVEERHCERALEIVGRALASTS
jgi:acetylornithine aminotransferase